MAINKVVYGDRTLIDLTNDTITAAKLLDGETAHDASGRMITGYLMQTSVNVNNGSVSKISGTTDDYLLTLTT